MVKFLFLVLAFVSFTSQAGEKIQHWVTDNGVRVYFYPAPELPMMDLRIVFDAGAARDGDKKGVALMTNGMLAEGAGNWDSGEIAARFDGVGAVFSNSSHRDMSVMSLRSLTDEKLLKTALTTFTTVLTNPTFPKDAFERERKRLLIGLERQKQSPDAISDKVFYSALYGDHPYASETTGEIETVQAMTIADLKAFYQQYFVAKNAVIALVGALDREQAEKLVNDVVADLSVGSIAEAIPEVNKLDKADKIEIAFPSSQSHIMVGQPGIKRGDADYFPLYVGNHVLGGSGMVSKLFDEIREKRGLAYSSYSYFIPMRQQGPFLLGLQTKNESADAALKVLHDVVADFVKNGPSEKDLIAAKKNLVGGFALRIASNKSMVENLASIGFYNQPLDYLETFISNVEAVTLAQVKDAFQRRVNPDKLVTVIVGDTSKAQAKAE